MSEQATKRLRKFSDDDGTYAVYQAGSAMGRLLLADSPKAARTPPLGAGLVPRESLRSSEDYRCA